MNSPKWHGLPARVFHVLLKESKRLKDLVTNDASGRPSPDPSEYLRMTRQARRLCYDLFSTFFSAGFAFLSSPPAFFGSAFFGSAFFSSAFCSSAGFGTGFV